MSSFSPLQATHMAVTCSQEVLRVVNGGRSSGCLHRSLRSNSQCYKSNPLWSASPVASYTIFILWLVRCCREGTYRCRSFFTNALPVPITLFLSLPIGFSNYTDMENFKTPLHWALPSHFPGLPGQDPAFSPPDRVFFKDSLKKTHLPKWTRIGRQG